MKKNIFNESNLLKKWFNFIKKNCLNDFDDSIDRVFLIAKRLNLFPFSSFVITVAGTNGKGSTCKILEQYFLRLGYTVGLYTSPHFFYHYERVRINGKYITNDNIYIHVFYLVSIICGDTLLTYFEFITLSILLIFKNYYLDIVILEVGLGGRLDATNVINPDMAIITNIALDHVSILGKTRNMIGYEKSGIFRKKIPVIIGDCNIPYSVYQQSYKFEVYLYRFQYEWNWIKYKNFWNFYDHLGVISHLPIDSKISIFNIALAIAAIRVSPFQMNDRALQKTIRFSYLLGRFDVIHKRPYIILDVAHNPHSAIFLYNKLKQFLINHSCKKVYGVIGMLSTKDVKNTIFTFKDIIDCWYYKTLLHEKTASYYNLKKYLPYNANYIPNMQHILCKLLNHAHQKDVILIFGSFHIVSEAMIFFKKFIT
ncbi:bifunctional tetrahydrofolate synthase/dihydrofolate synthase [Buchnera aphidicola]|uniref:bifunctional tetrahydrofolate synthase/dihydrofolate synthase n=1 Tax=Buchnera aphidicola TaxID=9 RepID=UPI0031B84D3E